MLSSLRSNKYRTIAMNASDHVIDGFRINDKLFYLTHNYDDDSRSLFNEAGDALIRFDSSCGVYQAGKKIGTLISRDDNWSFQPFEETGLSKFVTSQPIRDYHWLNLQRAEIEVAKHLLM